MTNKTIGCNLLSHSLPLLFSREKVRMRFGGPGRFPWLIPCSPGNLQRCLGGPNLALFLFSKPNWILFREQTQICVPWFVNSNNVRFASLLGNRCLWFSKSSGVRFESFLGNRDPNLTFVGNKGRNREPNLALLGFPSIGINRCPNLTFFRFPNQRTSDFGRFWGIGPSFCELLEACGCFWMQLKHVEVFGS